jgi:5-methyltetrahydrofolate--homocysteine methyltransferase
MHMQADYALDNDEDVYLINKCAAELAKKSTADYMAKHPGEVKFVAGAIGPTNKTLSVSPSVENPALRGITYDEVEEAYYKQVREGIVICMGHWGWISLTSSCSMNRPYGSGLGSWQ